jgi:hypothetical protein
MTNHDNHSSAASAIAALAKRFWSIHPKEIQDMGITREQFYEREMIDMLAGLSAGIAGLTPDLMNATTVSCTGLDITIACNDHGTKDALMDVLVDAAYMPAVPQAPREMWAMLYLHDWDPPKEGQEHRWEPGKNVFPEIHAVYETLRDANAILSRMSDPKKYWVRRVWMPAHDASSLVTRPQR